MPGGGWWNLEVEVDAVVKAMVWSGTTRLYLSGRTVQPRGVNSCFSVGLGEVAAKRIATFLRPPLTHPNVLASPKYYCNIVLLPDTEYIQELKKMM